MQLKTRNYCKSSLRLAFKPLGGELRSRGPEIQWQSNVETAVIKIYTDVEHFYKTITVALTFKFKTPFKNAHTGHKAGITKDDSSLLPFRLSCTHHHQ